MKSTPAPAKATSSTIKWSGCTDRGKSRTNNEDSFLGLCFNAKEVHHLGKTGAAAVGEMNFVFAVCDGMGGALAGEFASRIAVEKITKLLPHGIQNSGASQNGNFKSTLDELYKEIHRSLAFLGNSYSECRGMETTLSLFWFAPGRLYYGHIGDSRLYCLSVKKGALQQLSEDDTHVGWLLRTGKINEREARAHPRRNVLQKALGGEHQFVDPQVGVLAYEPGDIFLICSDGLVDGLHDEQIMELLRGSHQKSSPENPAQLLVDASLKLSGRDNTTALVVTIG